MNKSFTILKDITAIEEELASQNAGVLALMASEDKIMQLPCTFLYYHKNIYAALQPDEDLLESLIFDSNVSFTTVRSEKVKASKNSENSNFYKLISVTLNGILRRPEDVKISDEIKSLYSLKYTGKERSEEDEFPVVFLMLDTVEIKASEEAGG
jgi:hypothetical protein